MWYLETKAFSTRMFAISCFHGVGGREVPNYRKHHYGWMFLKISTAAVVSKISSFPSLCSSKVQMAIEADIKRQSLPWAHRTETQQATYEMLDSSGVKRVFNYSALCSGIAFLAKQRGKRCFLTGSNWIRPLPPRSPRTKAILPHRRNYFKLVS